MTTFRSENVLVGLIAAAVVPWISWTLSRGLRDGKLPIGRAYVHRHERRGAFNLLLALYIVAALMAAIIALDLLFGLRVGDWL